MTCVKICTPLTDDHLSTEFLF